MTRVLIVEDEPHIMRALEITIRASGYDVECARTASDALTRAGRRIPDLVLLDLGLPDRDGLDVIRMLRSWTDVPIVVLSGRTSGPDKVSALDEGADDYVTKPFSPDELLARLRAVTRRQNVQQDATPIVRIGRFELDLATRTVAPLDGEEIALTPTEWDVLEVLVRSPGRLVTHRELATRVWGRPHSDRTDDSLRTYLLRLRHKLEPEPARPQHLLTEPGMGYRFRP